MVTANWSGGLKYTLLLLVLVASEQVVKTKKAIGEVISLQEQLGIDVISDGEMKRENYVHYFW